MKRRATSHGWPVMTAALLSAVPAQAEDPPEDPESESQPPPGYDVSVFGDAREVKRVAGSADRMDEEELERFEDDNSERILTRFTGVYVRGEDGYGLRPNIGLRGASSDRSAKVTLMEDGVLLGPAPYSAPAAYYFPLMTRMTAVEVFKGPSAIRHGPNTIGGAINFVSRPIPYHHRFGADLAYGTESYGKGHAHYGYGSDHWGFLVEGVRIRSDGFKELDSAASPLGDNTGFDKIELVGKARINTDPAGSLYNEGTLKLGYAREVSNETYLGLSDADFAANPLRRYAASALDRMRYQRFAVQLAHGLVYGDDDGAIFTMRTTAYRHDFHRAWRKLNAFDSPLGLSDILSDPTSGQRAVFHDVLTGAADSASDEENLLIGTNDRTFVSQGIQSAARWRLPVLGPVHQHLMIGARLHHDSIERLHTEDPYAMRAGLPRLVGEPTRVTTDNVGSTIAFAGYMLDEVALGPVMVVPGIRVEYIANDFEDALTGIGVETRQRVLLPGVGVIYQPIEELAFLGGVHQGFSPVTPGQGEEVQPEVAVNYEAGARVTTDYVEGEAIGFVSDYSNLSGQCTFSSGCAEADLDKQFNAGEALIAGVEVSAKSDIKTPIDLRIPLSLAYTFTHTELLTSFTSDNPQLGDVAEGDELPYVPQHQVAASLGVVSERWGGLALGMVYVDSMREVAGQGEPAPGTATDAYVLLDASAELPVLPELSVYAKVENLLDSHDIVARRPFGARPNRPRFVYGGVKVTLDP